MKRVPGGCTILLTGCLLAAPALAKELPLETFFKRPDCRFADLSPDGKQVSMLVNEVRSETNHTTLLVMNTADRKGRRLSAGFSENITWYSWVNSERLVFRAGKGGFDWGGLYGVKADGTGLKELVPSLWRQAGKAILSGAPINWYRIIGGLRGNDEDVLIESSFEPAAEHGWSLPKEKEYAHPAAYRLNAATGARKLVEKNPGDVIQWFADRQGTIRLALAEKGTRLILRHRAPGAAEWLDLMELDPLKEELSPLGFDYNGKTCFVASNIGRNTTAVFKYDFERRSLGPLVYGNDTYDVRDLIYSPSEKQMIGVRFEADRPVTQYLTPQWRSLQVGIQQALPNAASSFIRTSDDGRLALVASASDRNRDRYFLMNLPEHKMEWLADAAEWIKPDEMAAMKPIEYHARDGLLIHGYLTLPAGAAGRRVPLIVNPHGGPWARDTWEFNDEVQFLASRGYAVLQMNFRGSEGYGQEFLLAGMKEWGRKMQDDVSDGVRWAIESGIADADRVCIYGASYGGYAALTGLTSTPELYRCGIVYAGVTDLKLMLRALPKGKQVLYRNMTQLVGDPEKEKELLEAASPLRHVAKLRAPLLIAHGELDEIAEVYHARNLAVELNRLKKKYKIILEEKEGHGFREWKAVKRYYEEVEKFLKENLK